MYVCVVQSERADSGSSGCRDVPTGHAQVEIRKILPSPPTTITTVLDPRLIKRGDPLTKIANPQKEGWH